MHALTRLSVVLALSGSWLASAVGTSSCGGSGGGRPAAEAVVEVPAVTNLAYPETAVVFRVGAEITPLTPTSEGGAPDEFAVTPPLPPGLDFDPTDGRITGAPAEERRQAPYTIRAANASGEDTTILSVTVLPRAPCLFGYAVSSAVYPPGVAIEPNEPLLDPACGAAASFSIEPDSLPTGLEFDGIDGVLTGVPQGIFAEQIYAVTAANAGGTATTSLSIRVTPIFHYSAPSQDVIFDADTGEANFMESLYVEESTENRGFPNGIDGLVMVVSHDPDLLEITEVRPGLALQEFRAGTGPDFVSTQVFPAGFTLAAVMDYDIVESLFAEGPQEVGQVDYGTRSEALAGATTGLVTSLVWTHDLGDPPLGNLIAVGLTGIEPLCVPGSVRLEPGSP